MPLFHIEPTLTNRLRTIHESALRTTPIDKNIFFPKQKYVGSHMVAFLSIIKLSSVLLQLAGAP